MGIGLNRILDRFAWYLLCAVAFLAPLALGSAHQEVVALWTAASGMGLVAYVLLAYRQGQRIYFDGLVVLGFVAMALMALQLLPIGEVLLAKLSPVALENVEFMRTVGVDLPTRISLAPTATLSMILLLACAICLYLLAFNFSFRNRALPGIPWVVAAAGAMVVLATVFHAVGGNQRMLGFYIPQAAPDSTLRFVSTFVNNNHGAAFLNLTLFSMVGMWRAASFGRSRGLWFFLVMGTGAASFLMLSRAGILSMIIAMVLMGIFTQWAGVRKEQKISPAAVMFGAIILLACAVAFLAVFDLLLAKTEGIELLSSLKLETKHLVWEKGLKTLNSFGTAGAGAGAFGVAFSPENTILPSVTVPHLENELLEPLVEFGTLIGAALIGALAFFLFRRLVYSRRDHTLLGIMCGVMAVWFHNLADFNIRVAGVLLPLTVLVGVVSGHLARAHAKDRKWKMAVTSAKVLPLAILLMFSSIASTGRVRSAEFGETARFLNEMRIASREDTAHSNWRDDVERRLQLHPYDGHIMALAGMVYLNSGAKDVATKLCERARTLCPTCPLPIYASVQLERSNGQFAAMLLRLLDLQAVSEGSRDQVMETLATSNIPPAMVGEVWGPAAPDAVVSYARHLRLSGQLNSEKALLQAAIRSGGRKNTLLRQLIGNLLIARDYVAADEVATWMLGLYPNDPHGYLYQARIYHFMDDSEGALLLYQEAFARAAPESPERIQAGLEMMRVLARARNWSEFDHVAADVQAEIGSDPRFLSGFHKMLATKHQMRGRLPDALKELDLAESSMPLDEGVMLLRGELLLRKGESDRALAEFRKVLKLYPGNARAARALREWDSPSGVPDHTFGAPQGDAR